MAIPRKIRIGEMLVNAGILTVEQLAKALAQQKSTGHRLGRVLIDSGLVDEIKLSRMLADQLGIAFVDLQTTEIDRVAAQKLSERLARRHRALVLGKTARGLRVGMADPTDLQAYDELTRVLSGDIELVAIAESQLLLTLERVYQSNEGLTDLVRELKADLAPDAATATQLAVSAPDDTTPVARLLNSVFEDAARAQASDIHFEPQADHLSVRFRVDGALRNHARFDAEVASALVLRLKLISNLDIAEKRMPQDGRFEVLVRNAPLDMRISIMPSYWGESVVLRLLDSSKALIGVDQMGMPAHTLSQVQRAIAQPTGMILVTGPTGSGKTTTLYALLAALRGEDSKLVTVEDPVEYRLAGITQVQVNEKIELSFSRVLRSVLRHDPDVVMVGEMRDTETAEIGVRAAMTGHLVLSTLHTNSAAVTATRLADMGVPAYMLATSLQLIVAQRLVRRLCPHCRVPAQPTPQEHAWLLETVGSEHADRVPARAPRGCPQCRGAGFSGRAAVFESLEITRGLADALAHGDTGAYLRAAEAQLRGRTLAHDAVRLVREGVTTLHEAMRVAALVAEDA
ncbi:MAG TPA: GspE/PulE family protein [Quisquiliibacterium sp.]|nr:GspE/PulE family protein [Quisquiliibacterium sp.]HQN12807.1 GspE/PulE family protein [Quisquiliibacterium sp.]